MKRLLAGMILTACLFGMQIGCSNALVTGLRDKIAVDDPVDPKLPDTSTISFDSILNQSLYVSWQAATDNWTSAEELEYFVAYSLSADDVDAESLEASAIIVENWTAGMTKATITGLDVNTEYFVNVAVRDRGGNKVYYTVSSETTANDTDYPQPGGTVVPTVYMESIGLTWPAGSDLITPANELEYRVLVNCTNPVDPRTDFESLGWTVNTLNHTVTELVDDIEYEITVQVRDAALNQSDYSPVIETTVKHPRLFWTDAGSSTRHIRVSEIDGTGATTIVTGLWNPTSIDVDPVLRKIYWVDDRNGHPTDAVSVIQRANFDGTNRETLIASGLSFPYGLAVDYLDDQYGGDAAYLYWTDYGTNQIFRSALTPSTTAAGDHVLLDTTDPGVAGNIDTPGDIAVDVTDGTFFWTEFGASARIRRAAAETPTSVTNIATGLTSPIGVTLETANNIMYWTEVKAAASKVRSRIYSPGTIIDHIITMPAGSQPEGIAYYPAGDVLFWANSTNGTIYRTSPNTVGGDAASDNLILSLDAPKGVAVY
jgi:hypothetical protein